VGSDDAIFTAHVTGTIDGEAVAGDIDANLGPPPRATMTTATTARFSVVPSRCQGHVHHRRRDHLGSGGEAGACSGAESLSRAWT
jgi:hypothetical protein